MPDIIGARCFGCGFVVRVPATLGGRKTECPQCAGPITIPTPWDSTMGIVPDSELPQVGDGTDAPPEPDNTAAPAPKPASHILKKSPTGGSRAQPRRPAPPPGTGRRPAPTSQSTMILVIVVAALLIIGVAVAVVMRAR